MSAPPSVHVDVLVVGAGLAGVAAACVLAEAGMRVRLVEQAPVMGGAVLRQPLDGMARLLHNSHRATWAALTQRLNRLSTQVQVQCRCQFSGCDSEGRVLLLHSGHSRHEVLTPRAVVVAVGATERVRPRPGWDLPGVSSAGALQVGMKMAGVLPPGRVLLAGSGPLLLAVGAQMVQLGMPPVAIVEAARPARHWRIALGLPWDYWREALGYLWTLRRAGVPVYTGVEVRHIERSGAALQVVAQTPAGEQRWTVDALGLHDGLAPHQYPPVRGDRPLWRAAGDGHEVLGARAAAWQGERVGAEVARLLGAPRHGMDLRAAEAGLVRERAAQHRLQRMYAVDEVAALADLPPDTVLCRCEHRTMADLRALGRRPSARELRLLGRFGMGACQGRMCGQWVQRLVVGTPPSDRPHDGVPASWLGAHWPVRPLDIAALLHPADIPDGAAEAPASGLTAQPLSRETG